MSTAATRLVGIVMEPKEENEAAGVTIRRTIGSEKLVLLDPFLLLDHLHVGPGTPTVGFPRHPHRGIETLTYVFSGRVHHKDSLGNDSAVGGGGSQWMTAGAGIFHQEMLETSDEGNEGLQLWFNLPAARKMTAPHYQPAEASEIPEVAADGGATVRVVAGSFGGATGPFRGIAVNPTVLDVRLPAGAALTLPATPGQSAFAYVYRGTASVGPEGQTANVEAARLGILTDGDGVRVANAGSEDARLLFVAATPTREPVLQYRSLVMNTVEEMKQAIEDLANGTFAKG